MKNLVFALFVCLMVSSLVDECISSPMGAPEKACASMLPGHQPGPQQRPSPFEIVYAPLKSANNDERSFQVWIAAEDRRPFKGFFIQARANKSGEAIGKWKTNAERTKLTDCFGQKEVIFFNLIFFLLKTNFLLLTSV